jgi:CheY-like chemotaxis protein
MTRILYVEHIEDNVYMPTQRLTRHDLILMDLGLPSLDGGAAARQLKQMPETKDVPILALSAHTMPGDRKKALNAGCDAYDAKPIVFERLLEKIDALIRKRLP